ncbi:hypothetical protein [Calothrix sp. NIES-2098]|uniref:hypothetical protein n=1 Tax=Calothrix sp. NIES-2098 TaxID=1954171 RepID=UPI000B60E761|nr:hypothetical protein NIES2098_69430 [Calothrix sp. NIES-2098]
MSEMPVSVIIPIFTAISDRQWEKFQELEANFVLQHGVEVWQEVFNFRIKPALDKESDRWLLIQWCGQGIHWVKNVS